MTPQEYMDKATKMLGRRPATFEEFRKLVAQINLKRRAPHLSVVRDTPEPEGGETP